MLFKLENCIKLLDIQCNDLIQEMWKENVHFKSKHNHEFDNQLYNQFNELKKEFQN